MEKSITRKNIFGYIAEFFRSIGASAQVVFSTEEEEFEEGLSRFDASRLSKEDAKILKVLQESQDNEIAGIEKAQAVRMEKIDYPSKGKEFKKGMKVDEQERDKDEEREKDEDGEERELD